MFFLVGFGDRKTRVIGPVEKRVCPNCRNEDFWELHQLRDYVSVFFIPIIPYKTQYLIVCPICHLAHPVDDDRVDGLRAKAEKNLEYLKGSG